MKVEIGGGPSPQYPSWIQLDAIDWKSRTGLSYIIGDCRNIQFNDNSVSEIFASNVLEHVSFLETNATLKEWLRILIPSGILTVVVPDLLGLFQDFLNGVNPWHEFVERVYGSQTYDLDLHRAGFTLEHMPKVFTDAGFDVLTCDQTHAGGGVTIVGQAP